MKYLDQYKIGKFIASRRKQKNLTQAQLEECLDFSNEFCTLSVMDYGAIAPYPEKVTVYN